MKTVSLFNLNNNSELEPNESLTEAGRGVNYHIKAKIKELYDFIEEYGKARYEGAECYLLRDIAHLITDEAHMQCARRILMRRKGEFAVPFPETANPIAQGVVAHPMSLGGPVQTGTVQLTAEAIDAATPKAINPDTKPREHYGTYLNWLTGDDTSAAAVTILHALTSLYDPERFDPESADYLPYDSDDFGSCYRLLESFPEFKSRLHEVVELHPSWGSLVEAWPKLSRQFEDSDYAAIDDFVGFIFNNS